MVTIATLGPPPSRPLDSAPHLDLSEGSATIGAAALASGERFASALSRPRVAESGLTEARWIAALLDAQRQICELTFSARIAADVRGTPLS
jgi:hypothetical protein